MLMNHEDGLETAMHRLESLEAAVRRLERLETAVRRLQRLETAVERLEAAVQWLEPTVDEGVYKMRGIEGKLSRLWAMRDADCLEAGTQREEEWGGGNEFNERVST
ncbi:hypothetical protein FOZ62_002365, partial [Perkinsus olseni]